MRSGKAICVSISSQNITFLTEGWLEKYVKKFLSRTKMEDALRKLDKLMQEEP